MKTFGLCALLALSLALFGCGGSSTTVIEKTVTETAPAAASTTNSSSASSASDDVETSSASSSSSDDGGKIVVPDVVGKDHQLAQDTMQAAGLYNLAEEDATGQGRMLLYDRNWTVVSQDPPAGTRVNEDSTITLRSKKDSE